MLSIKIHTTENAKSAMAKEKILCHRARSGRYVGVEPTRAGPTNRCVNQTSPIPP